MIIFFLLAACLVIVVLALLLPTLTRTHQSADRRELNIAIARSQLSEVAKKHADGELKADEFDREKQRLEHNLADALSGDNGRNTERSGSWVMWPLAAFVPLVAGVVYLTVGTPDAINPVNRVAVNSPPSEQQEAPDMREVVAQIRQRLEAEPNDPTGWFMLGRAHMNLEEYADAAQAIRRAHELTGNNPEIMVRLADAIAMSQGGSMVGEPETLLLQALAVQPQNLQALWLLGMAQSERGDYSGAIATWENLHPLLDNDQRSQQQIAQLIDEARARQGGATVSPPDAETAASLSVEVSLDNSLDAELKEDTAVFIYAKAQQGPPMPLAVKRVTVGELPVTVSLSDVDAMMPQMKISAFEQLVVGARVSLTGDAIAQPGDFFGEISDVAREQAATIKVNISEVVR